MSKSLLKLFKVNENYLIVIISQKVKLLFNISTYYEIKIH